MITIIGTTLGIPDTVMGLTFVAAGVSIPDALSSIAVIKEGYGDMAVSNAVGSNVFDILVCLGLPWLIQTTILVPGGHVNVISKGIPLYLIQPLTIRHSNAFSFVILCRTYLFNVITAIDCCIPTSIGSFEWLEIGSSSWHNFNGLVFPIYWIGINV